MVMVLTMTTADDDDEMIETADDDMMMMIMILLSGHCITPQQVGLNNGAEPRETRRNATTTEAERTGKAKRQEKDKRRTQEIRTKFLLRKEVGHIQVREMEDCARSHAP